MIDHCPDCGGRLTCRHCQTSTAAKVVTEARRAASRRNGAKGGRPRRRPLGAPARPDEEGA